MAMISQPARAGRHPQRPLNRRGPSLLASPGTTGLAIGTTARCVTTSDLWFGTFDPDNGSLSDVKWITGAARPGSFETSATTDEENEVE